MYYRLDFTRRIQMNKKRIVLLCLCFTLFLLAGCQKDPSSPQQASSGDKSGQQAPPDDLANHGVLAIMETENGYYYNYGYADLISGTNYHGSRNTLKHLLRYYDKATQETILLCSKPECEHQGDDTCVATYKNLCIINSLLYDGQLYIYGLEKDQRILRLNLYRAALDGSSIDKVGTVLEVENTIGEGYSAQTENLFYAYDETFIIHKGYAYLPYYLRIGAASKGFMGGGLVQMDLRTGKTKTIYEMEYLNSYFPYNLKGCGDYIYMDLNGTKRYVISEDRLEYPPALQEERDKPLFDVVTENRLYEISTTYNEETEEYGVPIFISVYDAATGAAIPEEAFETDLTQEEFDFGIPIHRALPYEDMLVIAAGSRVIFYDVEGDNYGTKLAEIAFEYNEIATTHLYTSKPVDIKISHDKLYLICNPTDYNSYLDSNPVRTGQFRLYQVYSCPVEDILKGQGSWEKAFEFQVK